MCNFTKIFVRVALLTFFSSFTICFTSAADKIKMTMNWTADTAHLGFALAQKNGYYAEEDLEVTLEEGRGSSVAAQLVATGQSELGYADAGAALNVASKGAPIKIISTIWKSGQFGIQYLENSGIKEPKDLIGKKLSVPPGSAQVPLVPLFLKANGIKESEVEIVSAAQNANLGLLTSGQIDAVAETPENTVVPLAAQGIKAGNMYFYNHGVPIVSLSLIAREDKLAQKPEVYKRFIRATLKGWQEAIKNPEAAVDALKEVFPESQKSRNALLKSAAYSFSSACPGGVGDKLGHTEASTWKTIGEILQSVGKLDSSKPITAYFTNDFLPSNSINCP